MDSEYQKYHKLLGEQAWLLRQSSDAPIRIATDPEGYQRAAIARRSKVSDEASPSQWGGVGIVFEDEYLLILRDPIVYEDGRHGTFLRIVEKPLDSRHVVLLPVLDDKIVLLSHYRHATGSWSLELPRGMGETSDWRADATRELAEEIGGQVAKLQLLETVFSNNGLTSNPVKVIYAELKTIGSRSNAGDSESIKGTTLATVGEVYDLIRVGDISDNYTLGAITLAVANNVLVP